LNNNAYPLFYCLLLTADEQDRSPRSMDLPHSSLMVFLLFNSNTKMRVIFYTVLKNQMRRNRLANLKRILRVVSDLAQPDIGLYPNIRQLYKSLQ